MRSNAPVVSNTLRALALKAFIRLASQLTKIPARLRELLVEPIRFLFQSLDAIFQGVARDFHASLRCAHSRGGACNQVPGQTYSFPPGACHFPQYGEEYFRQLTSERLVTRMVKGFPRASWEKEPGRRNEALDCRVYARAAAAIYGLDRFEERRWRRMEEALARTVEPENEPASARPVRPPARQVIQSGYMAR